MKLDIEKSETRLLMTMLGQLPTTQVRDLYIEVVAALDNERKPYFDLEQFQRVIDAVEASPAELGAHLVLKLKGLLSLHQRVAEQMEAKEDSVRYWQKYGGRYRVMTDEECRAQGFELGTAICYCPQGAGKFPNFCNPAFCPITRGKLE
jgi:hypothetical protein